MTEEKATDMLVNALVDHTTKAVISSELLSLGTQMEKYCQCVSDQMSAMEDEALRNFIRMDKFILAFVKGWEQWKMGEETQAFETFCSIMK